MATRPQMGITKNAGDWRAASNSSGKPRGIYHSTLLGLYFASQRLRRISSRAFPMENMECERLRVERRHRDFIRPTIRRDIRSHAPIRIHRGRFTDNCSHAPDTVGRLCQTPARRNSFSQRPPLNRCFDSNCLSTKAKSRLAGACHFERERLGEAAPSTGRPKAERTGGERIKSLALSG